MNAIPHKPLDGPRLAAELPEWRVICLDRTGSTNDEARRLAAEDAPHLTAVMADEQTAGRGRRGAVWISPPRRNALVSVLWRPDGALPPEHWARLTLAAALAGCDALEAEADSGGPAEVKWPNDLYLSGRKVAGILVESTASGSGGGQVVIGSGFNLNLAPGDFPEGLRGAATSLWIERGGRAVDREAFLIRYLQALDRRGRQAATEFPALRDEAWRRSWLAGKRVRMRCAGEELEGVVEGLGNEGELLLREDGGGLRVIPSADLIRPVAGRPTGYS